MDEYLIDKMQARMEKEIENAIKAASNAERKLQPLGICHWCGEPVEGGRIFCNSECAEDHEFAERRK